MWRLPAALLAVLIAALVGIAPVSGAPPCGVGSHDPCSTAPPYTPPPGPPDMAITAMSSFETQAALTDGVSSVSGGLTFSTAQARTGTASLRLNVASGATTAFAYGNNQRYVMFGIYFVSLPATARQIMGAVNNLRVNPSGTLALYDGTTLLGTSTTALSTGRWYWIGWRNINDGANTAQVQIDGTTEISVAGSANTTTTKGTNDNVAAAFEYHLDDIIEDDAGFIAPSRVGLAKPISDVSRTDWTNDAAGTTLFSANNAIPPAGIADTTSGSGLHQTRDATNGTDTYVMNLTTYATLGMTTNDKVLAVQAFAATGAPSATSPKAGSFTVSNPTIANASFGNFYNGSAIAGTFPSGWAFRQGTLTTSPTITVANSPVLTIQQDTSSTRIAMVCFAGMYVAWTPGALGNVNVVGQAIARAGNY